MQLTLPAEVLATLTFSISAAVSKALLDVAQPLQSAAAAMTVPVWHPSPSAAAAAVPEVQFVPDPISLSSSEVNRGLGLVEANPSSTNADQTVLKTVNNAVQWVTSSLLPSAASQSENQLWFYDLILSGRLFNQMSSGSWAFRHLSPSLEKKPLMIPWPSWSMGQSSQRANRRFYNSNFHSVRQTHGTLGVQFLFFPIFWTYSYFLLFLN